MFDLRSLPPGMLARACGCTSEALERALSEGLGTWETLDTLHRIKRFREDLVSGRRRGSCTAWGTLTTSWGGPAAAARLMGLKTASAWDTGWRARIPFHRHRDVEEMLQHSPLAGAWELRNIDGRWLLLRVRKGVDDAR